MQSMQAQALLADEDAIQSDGVDSDRFSGSNSSFLANEKLVSVDSMNSDVTGTFFSSLKYLYVLDGLSDSIKSFQMMIPMTCLMMSCSSTSISWCLLSCREAEWRARRFLPQ